jgi:lysophospholipase
MCLTSGREDYRVKLSDQLKAIEAVDPTQYPDSVLAYFRFYELEPQEDTTRHIFGTFESQSWTLAAHIYIPQDYKATIILLHGYLNHSGQFKHLIKHLLKQNYAVALYDLPGHGLSTGPAGQIDDFSQYTQNLKDFIKRIKTLTKGPYHLIGFSTGASVAIDYFLSTEQPFLEKTILAAPLIRSTSWKASKTGFEFYSKFADTVPRIFRNNSSDKEFLKFNRKKDVLHGQYVGLKWVKALHDWNDKIVDLPFVEKPVFIIQGDKDTTVSWKHNIKFLSKKFPNANIKIIEGARHELFNESEQFRREILSQVDFWLNSESVTK